LSGEKICLDFPSSAFSSASGFIRWEPKSLCYELSDIFGLGLRRVYQGFYGGVNSEFYAGFEQMGLAGGEAIFLDHFGDQDQEKVVFQLRKCIDTFDKIFREFKKRNLKLPGEIIPLGVGLSLLYENLETEGRPFNVRAVFKRASQELLL
jgi:hypothetical protein